MCPCSLLLFVHIWKYFNSYTQCCFQHLVYKTRIKTGKSRLIWQSPTQVYNRHPKINTDWQPPKHLTEFIYLPASTVSQTATAAEEHIRLQHTARMQWCSSPWNGICPVPVYPNQSNAQSEIKFASLYHLILFPVGRRKYRLVLGKLRFPLGNTMNCSFIRNIFFLEQEGDTD